MSRFPAAKMLRLYYMKRIREQIEGRVLSGSAFDSISGMALLVQCPSPFSNDGDGLAALLPRRYTEGFWDFFQRGKSFVFKWAQQDSNLRPADYESAALTN